MKSRNTQKSENNDKSSYKIIYQKIKEEIKSVVITRLLNQVETLQNKYSKLQKENSLIKNDLIYILKRVFLNKTDYINLLNNNLPNANRNSLIKKNRYSVGSSISSPNNNSNLNCKSYNSLLSSQENINNNENYNNTSINKKRIEQRRYSIDDDTKKNNSTLSPLETSLQFNMQNKIDHYLNSLYKHNFAEECASGTSSVHLLNKEQSIYDELFSNKNKAKSLTYINTDYNYRKVSYSKDKKTSKGKNIYINDESDDIYNNKKHYGSRYKDQKIKTHNNVLKVHRKANLLNNKSKSKINVIIKKKSSSNKSSTNISDSSNPKKGKHNSAYLNNRSRFLVNKF